MNAHSHDYPNGPAEGQTDTSRDAAAGIANVTGRIGRSVYYAICERGAFGLTAEECATRLQMERTTVQPRTTELKLLGLIRDSGQRRPNRNGKKAICWVAVSNGEADHG
jgi:hypothetical protein